MRRMHITSMLEPSAHVASKLSTRKHNKTKRDEQPFGCLK